jgi:hypothetical protein
MVPEPSLPIHCPEKTLDLQETISGHAGNLHYHKRNMAEHFCTEMLFFLCWFKQAFLLEV